MRIRDRPDDLPMRMVFADWLEERNLTNKAEFLRLVSKRERPSATIEARVRELGQQLAPAWRAIIGLASIEKCAVFEFKCPLTWQTLASTDDSLVRHCQSCARDVYFCASLDEVRMRGRQGDCVAFCASLARNEALEEYDGQSGEIWMGEMASGPE